MMKLLFLDTETTGFKDNRLIQLAYKNAVTGEIVNEYFNPGVPIEHEAMAVHHITQEMIDGRTDFKDSAEKKILQDRLDNGYIIVAHNAKFDVDILNNEGVFNPASAICTMKIAKNLYFDLPQFKLQYLRYKLGVKGIPKDIQPHDALSDVVALEHLFHYLFAEMKSKDPVTGREATRSDEDVVSQMLEVSNTPVKLYKMPFGKYAGKYIQEVVRDDRQYFNWLLKELKEKPEENEDLIYTIEFYAGKRQNKLF